MIATMNETLEGRAEVENPIWLHQFSVSIKPNLVETSAPKQASSCRQGYQKFEMSALLLFKSVRVKAKLDSVERPNSYGYFTYNLLF